jgi:hypothetical protein
VRGRRLRFLRAGGVTVRFRSVDRIDSGLDARIPVVLEVEQLDHGDSQQDGDERSRAQTVTPAIRSPRSHER